MAQIRQEHIKKIKGLKRINSLVLTGPQTESGIRVIMMYCSVEEELQIIVSCLAQVLDFFHLLCMNCEPIIPLFIVTKDPGNKEYRKLVLNKETEYENGTRMGRGVIAMDIVRSWRVQDPPGRFLIKANDDELLWNDVGDDRAKEKTCQLFREHRRTKDTKKKVEPRKGFGVYTVRASS